MNRSFHDNIGARLCLLSSLTKHLIKKTDTSLMRILPVHIQKIPSEGMEALVNVYSHQRNSLWGVRTSLGKQLDLRGPIAS